MDNIKNDDYYIKKLLKDINFIIEKTNGITLEELEINEVLCEDCLNDYIKNMSHYTDDDSLRYEINHFNIIAQKLGMSEKATFTVDNKIVITT